MARHPGGSSHKATGKVIKTKKAKKTRILTKPKKGRKK